MITASAIAASREQTSPAPPRLLDVPQQAATERGHSVETIRAYVDWTTRFILFYGKRRPRDLTNAEVGRFLGHLRSRGTVACRGAGDGHRQEQPQHAHHDMLLPSLEPLAPVIAVRAADGEFASDRRRPYSSGGKRPSNRRFSRSITRRLVDVQDLHGDLAAKGLADQDRVVPAEVPFPTLFSRIE